MWTPKKRGSRGLQRVVDEPKKIPRSKVMAILVSKKWAKYRLLGVTHKNSMPAADPDRRPHHPAERRGGGTPGFADLIKKRIFGHLTSELSKDTTPNMLTQIEWIKNITNPLIGLRD